MIPKSLIKPDFILRENLELGWGELFTEKLFRASEQFISSIFLLKNLVPFWNLQWNMDGAYRIICGFEKDI